VQQCICSICGFDTQLLGLDWPLSTPTWQPCGPGSQVPRSFQFQCASLAAADIVAALNPDSMWGTVRDYHFFRDRVRATVDDID
jgi:hypothetical protein